MGNSGPPPAQAGRQIRQRRALVRARLGTVEPLSGSGPGQRHPIIEALDVSSQRLDFLIAQAVGDGRHLRRILARRGGVVAEVLQLGFGVTSVLARQSGNWAGMPAPLGLWRPAQAGTAFSAMPPR